MQADVQSQFSQITQLLQEPFWRRWEFWIPLAELVVGAFGLYFAIRAFREAKLAKQAATAAGRTVKMQTIAIELTEIRQKLERIQPKIKFSDARDLLTEISGRLYRATAPFVDDEDLSAPVNATRESLQVAHTALTKVRPTDPAKEEEAPHAVYYAIEDNFATISNSVAHLIGLFERETFVGDHDSEPR